MMRALLNRPTESPRTMVLLAVAPEASDITRYFARLGWDVHVTQSNAEARRLARTLEPDVVLLDTAVREESGWLTCAKLHFQFPEQTIVLLTDSADEGDREYAEFVGARAIHERKWGMEELAAEIEQAMETSVECTV